MSPQSYQVTNALRNSVRPALLLPFAQSGVVDPRITFTRASSATYFNSQGVLSTAANNTPRIDFDPVTGSCLGLLIEQSRTNSIPNNTMVGAVAGTPGTLPTTWTTYNNCGIVPSVVATGTEQGISYIDVLIAGTPTSTGVTYVQFNTAGISAANAQIWSLSNYLKIVSGSLTNFGAINLAIQETTTGGAYVTGGALATSPTTGNLVSYRPTYTRTLNGGATTALINAFYQINVTSGLAVNLTLRIGLPQLELGAFATSAIQTSGATATRAGELTKLPLGSWYNPSAFSLLIEGQKNTSDDTAYGCIVELNDGTANHRSLFFVGPSTSVLHFSATTSSADITVGTYALSTPYKAAGAITGTSTTTGTIAASLNGATAVTGTTTNLDSALYTNMNIAFIVVGGNVMNGWIQRIAYYPVAFSNTQLQAMSS
jgi:hypothetical protein